MPGPTPPSLETLVRSGPSANEGDLAQLLPELLDEYRARLRAPLGPVQVTVDGRSFPTLLDAFAEPGVEFARVELDFREAHPAGPGWEYLQPIERLEIDADGGTEVRPVEGMTGTPKRAMARVLLREHYPTGAASHLPGRDGDPVPTFPQIAKAVRAHGISPFQVALLLYFTEERFRYEIDLIGNGLLPDRRLGRLPIGRRVHRSSRLSHGVDAFVARGDLALSNARALEVLVDTHGLTDVEMSHVLGGVRELGRSALETLRSRQLASYDGRLGLYRPRLDAFLPASDRTLRSESPPKLTPIPDPALRTSVSELLAAAEARATCPLCGDALPPGHSGILCARCQQEIRTAG